MRHFLAISLLLFLTGLQAQTPIPENVVVTEGQGRYAPCEPSIAINPKNPANMVAGAILDNVCVSNDSGKTWQTEKLTSQYGVFGDPCIVADRKGRFYYFHLSDSSGLGWMDPQLLDRIVCQKSTDGGKSWNKGYAPKPNGNKDQDKQWAAIHPAEDYLVMTWTEFDHYGSTEVSCKSRINISFSKKGVEWTTPITISETEGNCIDNSETTEGAVPCFGPNGELYVSWSINGSIQFVTLTLEGKPWHKGFKLSSSGEQTVVNSGANWDFEIPGIGRCNGMPVTMCDLKTGSIHINWADQRNGKDDTDIWMITSTDGGETWSEMVRINNDEAGNHQFFAWSTIDPITGFIHAVFYDRRNHKDFTTDVYLATSKDGGKSFDNQLISAKPFVVPEGEFFGDYNNISAINGVVRPIWTSVMNRKLVVMTALINN